jgi:hypothetical protein
MLKIQIIVLDNTMKTVQLLQNTHQIVNEKDGL